MSTLDRDRCRALAAAHGMTLQSAPQRLMEIAYEAGVQDERARIKNALKPAQERLRHAQACVQALEPRP